MSACHPLQTLVAKLRQGADACRAPSQGGRQAMPITAFNSVSDGLDPSRRNRDHFITKTNVGDDGPWVPYADGVWIQPCCFDVTSGGFSVLLKGLPGAQLGVHYHV